ncbi:MAG: GNAT family N-acyltransferase [Acidobacteriota bacterium]
MSTLNGNELHTLQQTGLPSPTTLPFHKQLRSLGKRALDYLPDPFHSARTFSKSPSENLFAPVVVATEKYLLLSDIHKLPREQLLFETGEFAVFQARSWQLPHLLTEIGRLREMAFRAVGEGTGNRLDLDKYDAYYDHLFVWHKDEGALVGAYRIGRVDEILKVFGKKGLYTHTLFKLKKAFFKATGPMLELGRSFVNPDYQRTPSALFLLWKGIGQFILRHPKYKLLFGPVSISNTYTELSRQMMVDYLTAYALHREFADLVKPRQPFRPTVAKNWDAKITTRMISSVDELSTFISTIETDHKGIPTLLKHYLKLEGKILGFNVDAAFCNALDGLILVDLKATNDRLLERYLGEGWVNRLNGLPQ